MRKILLMRLFYLKKLDFKQLLQTYENHIIPSPVCYIQISILFAIQFARELALLSAGHFEC